MRELTVPLCRVLSRWQQSPGPGSTPLCKKSQSIGSSLVPFLQELLARGRCCLLPVGELCQSGPSPTWQAKARCLRWLEAEALLRCSDVCCVHGIGLVALSYPGKERQS